MTPSHCPASAPPSTSLLTFAETTGSIFLTLPECQGTLCPSKVVLVCDSQLQHGGVSLSVVDPDPRLMRTLPLPLCLHSDQRQNFILKSRTMDLFSTTAFSTQTC